MPQWSAQPKNTADIDDDDDDDDRKDIVIFDNYITGHKGLIPCAHSDFIVMFRPDRNSVTVSFNE